MNFTLELIGWIAALSIGWLFLGIGFGMFFGKTAKLNGVRRSRQGKRRKKLVVLELDSISRYSTQAEQEPDDKAYREFERRKLQT